MGACFFNSTKQQQQHYTEATFSIHTAVCTTGRFVFSRYIVPTIDLTKEAHHFDVDSSVDSSVNCVRGALSVGPTQGARLIQLILLARLKVFATQALTQAQVSAGPARDPC